MRTVAGFLNSPSGENSVGDGTITCSSSTVMQPNRAGGPWSTFIADNEHGAVVDTYADQKWAMRGSARMCFVNFAFRGPLRFDGVSEIIFVNPLFEAPIDAEPRVQKMYGGKHANCGPYLFDAHDIDIYCPTFRNAGTVANMSKSRNVTVAGFRAYDLGPSQHHAGYGQRGVKHVAARCSWHTDTLTAVGGKVQNMTWRDGEVGLPRGVKSKRQYTNARCMVVSLQGAVDIAIDNVWAHHFETPPFQFDERKGNISGRIEHIRSWGNLKNYRVPYGDLKHLDVNDCKVVQERPRGPAPWEAWVARDPLELARELIAARS